MPLALRILIVGGLCWLGYLAFGEVIILRNAEEANPAKLMTYFLIIIAITVVVGVMLATSLVPMLGDRMGNVIFSSNEQIEKSPHSDALSQVAQGNYDEAVDAYKKAVEENPLDTHAISEAVRIQCERLEDAEGAAEYLEETLQREWSMDDLAFLGQRLVDVYWVQLKDADRARPILEQIAENMPETRHAANAMHRMREIELAGQTLAENTPAVVENPEPDELGDDEIEIIETTRPGDSRPS